MQEANVMRDRMIREFTNNYIAKLFYFCLKKTGGQTEAEDLAQDIALNVLVFLGKGSVPDNFSAWIWQIARNRYSAWAKEKHKRNESVTGSDIGDYEIECPAKNVLDELLQAEQMALLRRELAFIKSDYRNIVVAYYIENRSIRDIASSLSESAVWQRLHRARVILKEGMDMAREFGKRSYQPEEITFTNSCSSFGNNGQPWSILSHALYKNIFLEAYGNPLTAEELSLELGVALPYMEDELEYLTKQTFLIRNGNKYETSFPIIGKDVQEKIWDFNSHMLVKLTRLLEKLVDDFSGICEKYGAGCYGKYVTYDDAKWVLLMRAFDELAYAKNGDKHTYTKRPDNGNWDIVGYQTANIPNVPWVGLHGSTPGIFCQYKFKYAEIESKTPAFLNDDETYALKLVAEGKWSCDNTRLDKLMEYGYIRKSETGYAPAIVVFESDATEKIRSQFSDAEKDLIARTVDEIRSMMTEAKEFAFSVTADSLPPLFKNDDRMCRFACSNSAIGRDIIFEQAVSDGWIRYDKNTGKTVGAYICL